METKKSPCFCRAVLAVLVIVFAWVQVSWANIALTVLGALLVLMALGGNCCCCASMCEKKEAGSESESTAERQ